MKTKSLLMTTALIFAGTATYAAVMEGDILGTTEAEIRAALESDGYTVQKVTVDGDEIEIKVIYAGVTSEIEVSSETGAVLEIEPEDHGDDDESDEDHDEENDDDEDDEDDDDDDEEDDEDNEDDDDDDEDDDDDV